MAVDIIYLCVCLIAMAGKCINAKLYSATSAIDTYIEDSFPKDTEFNETCVAEGCPALNNINLCQSGLEINVMITIIRTVSKCMRQRMCGKVIDPMPLRPLVLSTEEILPDVQIVGTCTMIEGANYVSNISNIQFETLPNQSQSLPLQMRIIIPNFKASGRIKFDFSFGRALKASLTRTTYELELPFISVITINQTGADFDVTFMGPIVRAHEQFNGFDMPLGFPDILSLLTASIQARVERSSLAIAMGRYLGKLYLTAIKAVINNCKSMNITI